MLTIADDISFDYKSVDWKKVKDKWDTSPMFFHLTITHGENTLTFQPWLDKTKRYRLAVYINGWFKGEYHNDDSPFQKYLNTKEIKPLKEVIQWYRISDKKCKKMTDAQIIKAKELKSRFYSISSYDNIAQIKKMVSALE